MTQPQRDEELENMLHEFICQPLTNARNGGYKQAKEGGDDGLLDLIEETEKKARTKLLEWAAKASEREKIEVQREILQDLLDWANSWDGTHKKSEPFNYPGAIKAMLVMKQPQKPFHTLTLPQPSAREEEGE